MSTIDERIALVLSWQISDAAVIKGKMVRLVSEQPGSALILTFTDGTWARFAGAGWERDEVVLTDEPPVNGELFLAGLITQDEHVAYQAAEEQRRVAWREAEDRRQYERLKRQFGA